MKNKPSILKKILSGITIFIFIKLVIALFTIGNKDFGSPDLIYNLAFGVIVMIFILYRVFQKSNQNKPIIPKKKNTSPPQLDNKPLHPK